MSDEREPATRGRLDHDIYAARSMRCEDVWHSGSSTLKLYTITATPEPMSAGAMDAGREIVDGDGSANGVGFVILHRGEEALWLLLHWWMPGGILAERLWSSPLEGPIAFEPRDRPLMACVWELVPIAFERDAYVRTVMNGRSDDDYLRQRLPDGRY